MTKYHQVCTIDCKPPGVIANALQVHRNESGQYLLRMVSFVEHGKREEIRVTAEAKDFATFLKTLGDDVHNTIHFENSGHEAS